MTTKRPLRTIRAEARAIVDEAKLAGKPITARIIWGLMSREVPEDSFVNLLSSMCGSHQLVRVEAPPELASNGASCYEPGPVVVTDGGGARDGLSRLMGNMEHRRLEKARAAARKWLKQPAARRDRRAA